ncbi:unnamed protein product [Closterium sp. Naga37s-1]|nr:unnamed protein product [Closterium sp. Naga37s-1]
MAIQRLGVPLPSSPPHPAAPLFPPAQLPSPPPPRASLGEPPKEGCARIGAQEGEGGGEEEVQREDIAAWQGQLQHGRPPSSCPRLGAHSHRHLRHARVALHRHIRAAPTGATAAAAAPLVGISAVLGAALAALQRNQGHQERPLPGG